MYKNHCESAYKISDTYGTSNSTEYGTANIADYNLQTKWLTDGLAPGNGTVANILFDFGTSIFVDSLIVVHNMNTGTLFFSAGNTIPVYGTASSFYGLPINESTGTSIKFLGSSVDYRYWRLWVNGTNMSSPPGINEIFIGQKDTFPINPSYPFRKKINISTIRNKLEKGKNDVYFKYSKMNWDFNYPFINSALYGTMIKMRNSCKGSYKPFFFCIDIDQNPFETYMVRFIKNSFRQEEISYNIYNISFSIEEEK